MSDSYDFIVIGGGSAGYAGVAEAARHGLSAAVIEGGAEVGGLCILRGCMPSKTLLESANRFDSIRRASEFGLRSGSYEAVGAEIIARKHRLIHEFAAHRQKQLQAGRFDFIRGRATFLDANRVEVTWPGSATRRLSGGSFLVATGSTLKHIDFPGLKETGVLDSDGALEQTNIPKSLIVLGGGAISMEFAHYYVMLGTEVTVLQRSRHVLSGMDADVAGAASDAMEKRGVRFFFRASVERLERAGDRKRVVFKHEGEEKTVEAEEVLYALGRVPKTEGLDLEAAGVETVGGRIATRGSQQTNVPHIFAAGDVAGPYEIVHIGIHQGEVAARNAAKVLAGDESALEAADYRLKVIVVFTMPEVAAVGMGERELIEARIPYAIARYPFDDHGKSIVMGETEGFVKLLAAEGSGEILGAAVVGPHASDLIHEIVVAMHFRAKASDLAAIPHYHPTLK